MVETGETAAREFAYYIRDLVETQRVRLLVIDSLKGEIYLSDGLEL